MSLPNYTTTPPGGWRYQVPETGRIVGPFSGWDQLKTNLTEHYRSTGYSIPEKLFEMVEAQICEKQTEYCAPPTIASRLFLAMGAIGHTFHTALSCLRTLASNSVGEKPTQELAESRAKVCAVCPENKEIVGCSRCNIGSLNSFIQKVVGAKKTESDGALKFCGVCHCNLRAKIWTGREAIWKHTSDADKVKFPESCWLKKEIPQ